MGIRPKDLLIFNENLIHSGAGYIDQPGRDGLINWRIFTYANCNSKLRHLHPANDGLYTYAARKSSDDRKEDGRGAREEFMKEGLALGTKTLGVPNTEHILGPAVFLGSTKGAKPQHLHMDGKSSEKFFFLNCQTGFF